VEFWGAPKAEALEQEAARPPITLESVVSLAWRLTRLVFALFLFVGALQLMKTGAKTLDLLEPGGFLVSNAGSTLGLGWLGALLVLSGSPIAASSLTLVAAGETSLDPQHFTEIQGFTMLTGSRLGAAFVVLVVAVVFALRGGKGRRRAPLSTAVTCLVTTAIVYVPAAFMGFALLNWGPYHSLEPTFPSQFADLVDLVYGGLIERVQTWPSGLIFLGGLGVLLLSFKVLDTVLPTLDGDRLVESGRAAWLQRKWPMFALGSAVALVTMSVAIALTVLVPLVAKNYVKKQNIIPYIMGANITTLGDTMLAAFALNSPAAVRIVLAEVIVTSLLSVILLTFFYPQLRSFVGRVQHVFVTSPARLAAFTVALFLVPVTTILVAGSIG
jgi:hypothetical protein